MSVRRKYFDSITIESALQIELNTEQTGFVKKHANIGTVLVLLLCTLPEALPRYQKKKKKKVTILIFVRNTNRTGGVWINAKHKSKLQTRIVRLRIPNESNHSIHPVIHTNSEQILVHALKQES